MAFNWNKFPWTNLHDLNLDWIIQKVRELEVKVLDAAQVAVQYTDSKISDLLTGAGDLTINKSGDVRVTANSVQVTGGATFIENSEPITLYDPDSKTGMTAAYKSSLLVLRNNQDLNRGAAIFNIRTPAEGEYSEEFYPLNDFAASVGYVKTAVNAVSGALATETENRTAGDNALQSTIDSVIMPLINALQKSAPRVFYFSTTAAVATLTADEVNTIKTALLAHTPVIFVAYNDAEGVQYYYYVVKCVPAPTAENINAGGTINFRTLDSQYSATLTTGSDNSGSVQFGGQPVSGAVDENNNIIISGSLADGTYTIKYENADGTYTNIGSFVVGATGPVYTNLFDPAAATLNQRWSNSSYAFTTSGGNGYVVSDYIPIPDISDSGVEHILRFRGGTWAGNAGVHYFNASKGVIQASDASSAGVGVTTASDTPTTDGNGVSQLTLGHKNGAYDSGWASAAYIRITLQINSTSTAITANDINDIIITIDEPIV